MANERITETIVRKHFESDPLFNAIKFEEQRSSVTKVKSCLSQASKKGTGKIGIPEFIISFPAYPDDIIIVECKASKKFHESENRDNPKQYAVDGVLHYAGYLSKEYNVIAIAVSGEYNPVISSFHKTKDATEIKQMDSQLLSIYSYITILNGEMFADIAESAEITKLAIELNQDFNDYSIVEYERCTLVSAILLALQDNGFLHSYKVTARTNDVKKPKPSPSRLAESILVAIQNVLKDNQLDDARVATMISEYSTINNKSISKDQEIKKKKGEKYEDNYLIRDIASKLEMKILPLIKAGNKGYDVLGKFYTEFIRYAGTDKKTGLVLTPKHITEFFCDLVDLGGDDVVFDSCCGTGGFLVSAMKYMSSKVGNDEEKKKNIKQNQLIGVEKRTDMFTFACSNMMMSGDGKSHIYQGDSFSDGIKKIVKPLKPTVAFLNPPYDVGEDGQLEFIENALSYLEKGGRCVAIVQMSCAISSKKEAGIIRKRLLGKHKLKAVLSMPHELFHPVGVVTCIMVFEAHKPHPQYYESFFGYYKDDGFVKKKNIGRIDMKNHWNAIRDQWIKAFINNNTVPELSVCRVVTSTDEWCAEAYMETDYSKLTSLNFQETLKSFIAFKIMSSQKTTGVMGEKFQNSTSFSIDTEKWQYFIISKLFKIQPTMGKITDDLVCGSDIPYISAKKELNGLEIMCDRIENEQFISNGGCIVFIQLGQGSAGYALYQNDDFIGMNGKTSCGYNKHLNQYNGLFIVTILDLERPKYSFGRSWTGDRLKNTKIKLPVDSQGNPDWQFMEDYIKSLPYSANL